MADAKYDLTFQLSDGSSRTVQFTAPQGPQGEQGIPGTAQFVRATEAELEYIYVGTTSNHLNADAALYIPSPEDDQQAGLVIFYLSKKEEGWWFSDVTTSNLPFNPGRFGHSSISGGTLGIASIAMWNINDDPKPIVLTGTAINILSAIPSIHFSDDFATLSEYVEYTNAVVVAQLISIPT